MATVAKRAGTGLLTAALLVAIGSAAAQDGPYPSRAVSVLYPYASSAAFDPLYRAMFASMSEKMGQSAVFESRPGASGSIALTALSRAKPDGYTIVVTNYAPLTLLPLISKEVRYDSIRDFAPITIIGWGDSWILAGPALTAKTFTELIAQAKAAPGTFSFAVLGSAQKLALAKIEAATGATFLQVPYSGTGQAETALLGGHVQLLSNSGNPRVLEKGGAIRLLATSNVVRNPAAPAVPTMAETVPGYDGRYWHGFIAPAGTPRERIDYLHRTIREVMAGPRVREMLVANGVEPADLPPAKMAEVIRTELREHAELVKKYNITN